MRFFDTRQQQVHCGTRISETTVRLRMALEFPDESLLGLNRARRISSLAIGLPPGMPEHFYEALWHRHGLNAGVHSAIGDDPFLPELDNVVFTYEDLQLDVDWDSMSADDIGCLSSVLECLSHETARGLIDQFLQAIHEGPSQWGTAPDHTRLTNACS